MIESELGNAEMSGQFAYMLRLHGLVVGNGTIGSQQPDPLLSFGER